MALTDNLTAIGDAIREKKGTTDLIPLKDMPQAILDISSGDTLPDWDDDSPIIASGYGYNTRTIWELTEKGTMRWKTNPNSTDAWTAMATGAGWTNTPKGLHHMSKEYREICHKIRQIYLPDGFTAIYLYGAPNCERIRLPDSIKDVRICYFTALKELEVNKIPSYKEFAYCYSIVKIELDENWTSLYNSFAANCWALKEIDIKNITTFPNSCFNSCFNLSGDIVFNPNLTSIGQNSFTYTSINSITFQNSIDNLPTIHTQAFVNCSNLTEVNLVDGWNVSLYVQSADLTQESLHDMIDKLADVTALETTCNLGLGSTNIAKIDEEHIAMLETKGWLYS